MNWINIETKTLRAPEYIGADPVQRATWLNLLGYCSEQENGGKLQRCEFRRDWVRVEPGVADNSLIALSGQGRTVHIGRFVRPELRPLLAREIRMALRGV